MKLRVLGCFGGELPGFRLTSFLIDEILLVDAGTIGSVLTQEEQCRIRHILISHYHLDHTNALPFFIVNVFEAVEDRIEIYGIQPVIEGLRNYILNDHIWPDFTEIPRNKPVLDLKVLPEHEIQKCGPYLVTAIPTHHTVPSAGFIIENEQSAIAFTSDTGPTSQFWEYLNEYFGPRNDRRPAPLKALITEASFPKIEQEIADLSLHMTPQTLNEELSKFKVSDVPVYIYHLKPQYLETIKSELKAVSYKPLDLLLQDHTYEF